ncbi:MAG TPA: sulfur carrier protein ThiS [Rhodospirillales bacterium]|nr:sulfur carrier protein ThiS [Rhodospirillales bacterium]
MNVIINGEQLSVDGLKTVEQLLGNLGLDGRKVAVERNMEIVPKSQYNDVLLVEGDKFEIVHFIGGGSRDSEENRMKNSLVEKENEDTFEVAGRTFCSRLLVGTGKYKDFDETAAAIEASGAEIVTVAVRRVNITDPGQPMLVDFVDPKKYTYLPNTAGCFTADDAVRTLRLAREAGGWDLVKLEVLGDEKTLYPKMIETLEAAEILLREDFKVMVYCSDDPIMAKRLEDLGCHAIMPLAAPIGSGLGVQNPVTIRLIKEQSAVPVLIDAGVGTASDAAIAMELGCDGVLMNTAIAGAKDPIKMARAMKAGVDAGRLAYLAGRMPRKKYADPSSPLAGLI